MAAGPHPHLPDSLVTILAPHGCKDTVVSSGWYRPRGVLCEGEARYEEMSKELALMAYRLANFMSLRSEATIPDSAGEDSLANLFMLRCHILRSSPQVIYLFAASVQWVDVNRRTCCMCWLQLSV